MDEVVSGLVIALHTTFQQNKDCNSLSNVQVVIFLTKAVAYDLPAKQGLQSDSNKVKRTLISDLHTTLPQNRASDLVSVIQNPGQPRGCCTYTPRQSNPHSITPKNFATV